MSNNNGARRPMVAGNWKMNGLSADGMELVGDLQRLCAEAGETVFELLVCPPASLLRSVVDALANSRIAIGGQDCHTRTAGAFTGDISASMLADAGASHVILGHSERRHGHGEGSKLVRAKAVAARDAGLVALICIGETEAERDTGQTLPVLSEQVEASLPEGANAKNTIVAYEPVWAIGTGRTPTIDQVAEAHSHIRRQIGTSVGDTDMRVLYGGSVKPDNAAELLGVADVDGALVGGASLKADDFWAIAQGCPGA